MDEREYYLGLDLGITSVGWAVTDLDYRLHRARGKDMWGVRLFEEANTAEERRARRGARRKRNREVMRVQELKNLFSEEIKKTDPGFFVRLEESMLWEEDRSEENRQSFSLFCDGSALTEDRGKYTDIEYYREYPTVFHLRNDLIHGKKPHDVRLLYLALLHMFKHRGHFRSEGLFSESLDTEKKFPGIWYELCKSLDRSGIHLNRGQDAARVEERFCRFSESKRKNLENLSQYLKIEKSEKREYEFLKLLCGFSVKLQSLFGREVLGNSFSLQDTDFEEKTIMFSSFLSEAEQKAIGLCRELYSLVLLSRILKGHSYICEAKVASFEKHGEDLKKLKRVMKTFGSSVYDEVFREMRNGIPNYSAYVGSVNSGEEKSRRNDLNGKMSMESKSRERFYKYLEKILSAQKQNPEVQEILEDIKKENFLPKQMTVENAVIPNQVYIKEMRVILSNASKWFPFLNVKDEGGRTVSDRILCLFSFHIPYFAGPLGEEFSNQEGYHVWAKRKEKGKIYPWNFEEKIDMKETTERYVKRTIRKCNYFPGENVLPENSMIYQKYLVLNELNGIRVKGEKLPAEVKKALYRKLFLSGNSVSRREVEAFLIRCHLITEEEKDCIGGLESYVKGSLSTVGKFRTIFGASVFQPDYMEMIERIVFWITVFGKNTSFLENLLRQHYGDLGDGRLSGSQIKTISGFKFSGWGNLSVKLLMLEGSLKSERNQRGVLMALWETGDTLEELFSERYTYLENLEQRLSEKEKSLCEWSAGDLGNLFQSPSYRRMVWQTIQVVREIIGLKGCVPKKIFLELHQMVKKNGKNQILRKDRLLELYRGAGEEHWIKELTNRTEAELRMKRMYLYYLQKGRCMYSGEMISVSELMDFSGCEMVPIFPRELVHDESIEKNFVLVKKEFADAENLCYPLSGTVRSRMSSFWKSLHDEKFIGDEKYGRLIRERELSAEEILTFRQRELFETGNGVNHITQLLKRALPDTEIIFIRRTLVNDYRRKYHFVRTPCVNDFHFAGDAYLSIAAGNEACMKYTGYLGTEKPDVSLLRNTLKKMTPIVTKRCFCGRGGLYIKDTLWNAGMAKEDIYLPQKLHDGRMADVTKYGGKTGINNRCYTLVEYRVRDKWIRSIEAIPVYLGEEKDLTEKRIGEYLLPRLKMENRKKEILDFRVCIRVIKYRSLLKIDGYFYYLGGKTGYRLSLENAVQWKPDGEHARYINQLFRAVEDHFFEVQKKNGDLVLTKEKNAELYRYLLEKMKNTIYQKRINFVGEFLEKREVDFVKLNLEEQCRLLVSVVGGGFQTGAGKIDLHFLGGSRNSGVMFLNKKISECSEVYLIHQSVTGLFESRVDLLRI